MRVFRMSGKQAGGAAQLPALKGRITLDKVTFSYRPDAPPVLKGIDLDIHPGEVIGIVGRSGSGKSTLTKLVQRACTAPRAGACWWTAWTSA